MNKFIRAIKDLDVTDVKKMVDADPKWLEWEEAEGKNALHFLCGVPMVEMKPNGQPIKNLSDASARGLKILKFLLESGMDMNSVHRIPDKNCGFFPATPVWWSYTRGRNETLYKYLLKQGADPRHCMYAITWYDDVAAADLFKKYGVFLLEDKGNRYFEHIDNPGGTDSPLLAAFAWKKWKMAEWLLKNGANPDSQDKNGSTALLQSVRRKYDPKHIKLLLKFEADPDRANHKGETPRHLASKYRDKTIYSLFG